MQCVPKFFTPLMWTSQLNLVLVPSLVFELVVAGIFNELVRIAAPLLRHLYFAAENVVKTWPLN